MMFGITGPDIFRVDFRKRHHFGYKNDVPMVMRFSGAKPVPLNNITKPNILLPSVKYESKTGNAALHLGIPDWVAFNNQILRFDAVTHEEKAPFLRGKLHFYKILYFLEDDSIQVVETKTQPDIRFRGTVLKRHRIPKPSVKGEAFYTLDDLNVNQDVLFYGTKYHIFDCDKFTRTYLTKLGIEVSVADDQLLTAAKEQPTTERPVSCPTAIIRPFEPRRRPFKQFLEFDGDMLQYYCVWIRPGGVLKAAKKKAFLEKLVLLYYLADDTIEIRHLDTGQPQESLERPMKPKTKIYIRRSRIPKERPIEPLPGLQMKKDMTEVHHQEHYTDKDLQIGATINAWGRQLFLYDCDDFTKKFMKLKYGIEMEALAPKDLFESYEQRPAKMPLSASRQQDGTPPCAKLDFVKFMTKDRIGTESHILRFLARFEGGGSHSRHRRFIISYYLVDDTISIYEKPQRNSGFTGGKFLDRCQVHKWKDRGYVHANDIYVGARICLNGHNMEILDADEYTLNYMEQHMDEFPVANPLEVLRKMKDTISSGRLQDMKKRFTENDPEDTGTIDETVFGHIISKVAAQEDTTPFLCLHEILTLQRHHRARGQHPSEILYPEPGHEFPESFQSWAGPGKHGIQSPLFTLRNELKKQQFTNFNGLLQYLEHDDVVGNGLLSKEAVLRLCIAYPLPVKKHLIADALRGFRTKDKAEVIYSPFVNSIDWRSELVSEHIKDSDSRTHKRAIVNYKTMISNMEETKQQT